MASAATRMGILEIAAHQLMLSLWLVIAFVQGEMAPLIIAAHEFGRMTSAARFSFCPLTKEGTGCARVEAFSTGNTLARYPNDLEGQ